MDFTYESGCVLSLFLTVVFFLFNLFSKFSTFEENLRRVGLRTSLLSGDIKSGGSQSAEIVLVLICDVLVIAASWLGIALWLILLIRNASRDFKAPEEIKRLRWQLKNVPMSKQQVEQTFMFLEAVSKPGLPISPVSIKPQTWTNDS